jgi:hypothetical protein
MNFNLLVNLKLGKWELLSLGHRDGPDVQCTYCNVRLIVSFSFFASEKL